MSFRKDPDATLDYTVDWTDWLDGDLIDSSAWDVDTGLTVESDSYTDTTATVWLSSGTEGEVYTATNQITTAAGRIDERKITIVCRGGLAA